MNVILIVAIRSLVAVVLMTIVCFVLFVSISSITYAAVVLIITIAILVLLITFCLSQKALLPGPSFYPLLDRKYLLVGTICHCLRLQGGSWYHQFLLVQYPRGAKG